MTLSTTLAQREPSGQNSADAIAIYRKIAFRIVPFLLLCYIVSFLDRVNLSFAKLQFMEDLGFSDAVYGLGAGLFYLTYVIFEVPSTLYMQRVGARATLMRIMVLWGLITMATAFIRTPAQLYIARCLLGAAEAGFFPCVILYLTYWFPSAYRARMTSAFLMGIPVSGLFGGPIAGSIMRYMDGLHGLKGWQLLFVYEGLPAVILGVIAFFYLDDGIKSAKWLTPREREVAALHLDQDETLKSHTRSAGLRKVFSDPRIYAAILVYFAITCGTVAISFWVPTLIHGINIKDVNIIGWLSAIPYFAATIGLWALGKSSDRTLERRWHVAGALFASALGFVLLASSSGNIQLTLCLLALAATGLYGAIPVFWTIMTAYLSRSTSAGGVGFISSLGCLGAFFSTAIVGAVKSLTGSLNYGMAAVGGIMALGAIILLVAFPAKLLREKKIDVIPVAPDGAPGSLDTAAPVRKS